MVNAHDYTFSPKLVLTFLVYKATFSADVACTYQHLKTDVL